MELTTEQMEEIIKANNKVAKCYKELAEAKDYLWSIEKDLTEYSWRNTKMSYWKDICAKYQEDRLINCYGDIFYVDETKNGYYIGRRVLWNLGLSNEQYYIEEKHICNGDDYDYTDYEISVKE